MSTLVVPYETRLASNFDWALREGSMHFEEKNAVQTSLKQLAQKLDEIGVPYAVAGGMALFYHGYRRFTEDVDILVTKAGLATIHERLEGLGYTPPFTGSKNLRDTSNGVRIEFLIAGDYPGDGKPKPVVFQDPASVSEVISGIKFLSLPTIIDMKLASGMSNAKRGKDIIDVQELITHLSLGAAFAEKLNPYVRDRYLELVRLVNSPD